MNSIDQGTVICGIRADKYPDICCSGIIISASCDIAQKKISKIYYLVAIPFCDWFASEHGFKMSYGGYIKSELDSLTNLLTPYSLHAKTVLKFSESEFKTVLDSCNVKKKVQPKLLAKHKELRLLSSCENMSEARCDVIQSNSHPAIEFIKKVISGSYTHYHFLPLNTYWESNVQSDGLIIDLQELGVLSFEDAVQIIQKGIDVFDFAAYGETKSEYYKKLFWLNDDSDFVIKDGQVKSPWREHLLQRFANGFVRIGLDDISDSAFQKMGEFLHKIEA